MRTTTSRLLVRTLTAVFFLTLLVRITPNIIAQQGGVRITPTVTPELPVEVETEMAPGSLKQAPLWKEIVQLLENPYSPVVRRPGFGVVMPPLNVWPLDRSVLTDEPLRLRTSDGEISWDQPGPMFDMSGPDDVVPTVLRTVIGELVVRIHGVDDFEDDDCPGPSGCLVVSNPDGNSEIPPDGTIVAVPAVIGGRLYEYDPATGEREEVHELETPINELDFIKDRAAAEVLGKALFWDMQLGSDGIQACGTCHFTAGVDNRTRNQLNPNHLGGDLNLDLKGPLANQTLTPADFPFHKLANPAMPGEPLLNPGNVVSDSNDVASSMGVRFRQFVDIPTPGRSAFGPAVNGVRPLLPDLGLAVADPIPAFQGLRRVEPRNTPTVFAAAFNFDNFWDGRARFHFNGGSVFGPSDPFFHVFVNDDGALEGADNAHFRPDLEEENPEAAEQPVRIKFSSLASLVTGPALSDFEMSFAGRNWQKIAKKLLQSGVTPLANQLVSTTDSVLGPYSNQNGKPGKPGLNISYAQLVELAFNDELWNNTTEHLNGAPGPDPFDGYVLEVEETGPADPADTNQFTQKEANFSLFAGLGMQAFFQLLIPDDTPFDRFMDANPNAANGVGQPGEQGTLPPDQVAALVRTPGTCPSGTTRRGALCFPAGFGPDELFGFDIFSGANLTAALPVGSSRNPAGFGSNPFLRTGRCMLCHLGPEQTDNTINVNHGLLLSDTEFEFPAPIGAPEPTGPSRTIGGFILEEELEEAAQDGVEIENRNFAVVDDPNTPWDDRQIGSPGGIAFQDNGIYNIGVRPTAEDIMRGGNDAFGWPLSLAALALKNLAGPDFVPCDTPGQPIGTGPGECTGAMLNFDPDAGFGGGLFEETGEEATYPGTGHTLQSINPGLQMEPVLPLMPEHMAPWLNNLPAGELHPLIDELAFAPNTITEAPFAEFGELLFGADLHCGVWSATVDPLIEPARWGAVDADGNFLDICPNIQSAITNNSNAVLNGTWPFANRVARNGAVKAPQLRNVELTGPYFHTGSYLTLRQVVDFYMRGGDFPITNAEDRDPNLVDITVQAFGFGSTLGLPPEFQEGLPDVITQYGAMPSAGATPEYATPEDAKRALVKFLIALTDPRVKFARAPFDTPEIFIPLDGAAPDLNGLGGINCGRASLVSDPRFRHIAAVGAAGLAVPLTNFLGVSSTEGSACTDHFDQLSAADQPDQVSAAAGGSGCAEVLPTAPPDVVPNVCMGDGVENLAPVAGNDAFTQTTLNQAYAVPGVLAGDTDPNGDTIAAELVTGLAGLALNADGSFTYDSALPAPGVPNATVVNFTYNATDGTLDSDVATVTIALNRTGAPIAVNDAVATTQNTPVTSNVDGNDNTGGEPGGPLQQASLTVRSQPANGAAVVVGATNRQVTYTPNPGFLGVDTYTYTISDSTGPSNVATATVTVGVNLAPRADDDAYIATGTTPLNVAAGQGILEGDTDPNPGTTLSVVSVVGPSPAGGTLNVSPNGSFTYTHNVNPAVSDVVTFTYQATDGSLTSNRATVTITVNHGFPNPDSGLVAAYSFDEEAGDVLDSATADGANNGTLNVCVTRVPGRTGGGLSFDGIAGMVTVPDAPALDIARMTISAWVYPTTPFDDSSWQTVILKERPTTGLTYGLYVNSSTDGGPGGYIRRAADAARDEHAAGAARLPANQWVHLAATYDGDVLRLYVNGSQVATFDAPGYAGNLATNGTALQIGGNPIWGEWFAGLMDDVRIHNRALTPAEIQLIMNTPVIP